jgi:hypothetical protein
MYFFIFFRQRDTKYMIPQEVNQWKRKKAVTILEK